MKSHGKYGKILISSLVIRLYLLHFIIIIYYRVYTFFHFASDTFLIFYIFRVNIINCQKM